jgi:hypothetical protein
LLTTSHFTGLSRRGSGSVPDPVRSEAAGQQAGRGGCAAERGQGGKAGPALEEAAARHAVALGFGL